MPSHGTRTGKTATMNWHHFLHPRWTGRELSSLYSQQKKKPGHTHGYARTHTHTHGSSVVIVIRLRFAADLVGWRH